MARPVNDPRWASNTVNEQFIVADSSGVETQISTTNKEEPPEEYKDSGILQGEPFIRQYINWFYNHLSDWIVALKEDIDSIFGRTITAGNGISGGGDLTTNLTLDLDINGMGTVTTVQPGVDYLGIYDNSVTGHRKISVETLLDKVLPVGAVYEDVNSGANPASLLGFGTWNSLGAYSGGTTTTYKWERTA